MFDYYGLPNDFPVYNNTSGTCYQKVEAAEKAFSADIGNQKFIPYIQLHEFEGLLFSSPKAIATTLGHGSASILAFIQQIRNAFKTPEEINQGADTHPSRRILNLFPSYNKPVFGSLIAQRTGLQVIRDNCPHFNNWVTKLLS